MQQEIFVFIKDEFFTKYDQNGYLMRNKGDRHSRPCFLAFSDKKEPNILWCVPISSQTEKFEKIVKSKIAKQQKNGNHSPKCNIIRFGNVLGHKKAFLIQNMFPITATYIASIYMDKQTHHPVTIEPSVVKDIISNSKNILKLAYHGYDNLIFTDIKSIYNSLKLELQAKQQDNSIIPKSYTMSKKPLSIKERIDSAKNKADSFNKTFRSPYDQKQNLEK